MYSRKVLVSLSCPILINRVFSTYTKFHENQSSWDRVVPSGRTERQTDRLAKLIVAFRNSAKSPKYEKVQKLTRF